MTREEILLRMNEINDSAEKATIITLCQDCNKEVCDERRECGTFDDCVTAAKAAIIAFLNIYVK